MEQLISSFLVNPAPPAASVIISVLILRVIKTTKTKEQTEALFGIVALTVIDVTMVTAWVLLTLFS